MGEEQLFHQHAIGMRWPIANKADSALLAIILWYPTSANVLLKMRPEKKNKKKKKWKLENNTKLRAYHICRAWYNGSYTMLAKPMKTLVILYPMIQALIKMYSCVLCIWESKVEK